MKSKGKAFNKNYYNIFSICQDFRQRLTELQRLGTKNKKKEQKDVITKK